MRAQGTRTKPGRVQSIPSDIAEAGNTKAVPGLVACNTATQLHKYASMPGRVGAKHTYSLSGIAESDIVQKHIQTFLFSELAGMRRLRRDRGRETMNRTRFRVALFKFASATACLLLTASAYGAQLGGALDDCMAQKTKAACDVSELVCNQFLSDTGQRQAKKACLDEQHPAAALYAISAPEEKKPAPSDGASVSPAIGAPTAADGAKTVPNAPAQMTGTSQPARSATHQKAAADEAPKPATRQKAATDDAPKPAAHQKAATDEAPKPAAHQKAAADEAPKPAAHQKAAADEAPKPAARQKASTGETPNAGTSQNASIWPFAAN
jgi:type IV secretory pathway VirB10-like protein